MRDRTLLFLRRRRHSQPRTLATLGNRRRHLLCHFPISGFAAEVYSRLHRIRAPGHRENCPAARARVDCCGGEEAGQTLFGARRSSARRRERGLPLGEPEGCRYGCRSFAIFRWRAVPAYCLGRNAESCACGFSASFGLLAGKYSAFLEVIHFQRGQQDPRQIRRILGTGVLRSPGPRRAGAATDPPLCRRESGQGQP